MKNYVGISRDHSGSMENVAEKARLDYNTITQGLKDNALQYSIDTILTVVECGICPNSYSPTVNRFDPLTRNSSINSVKPIKSYPANGRSTPLFDSVMMLIKEFENLPDAKSPDVSFLLMVITDGQDNASHTRASDLATKILELNSTDRWTITFRVPNGYKNTLIKFGIHPNNILEFDATNQQEYAASTVETTSAVNNYFRARSIGLKSTSSFYSADTNNLTQKEVRQELSNISKKVKIIRVTQADDSKQISHFVEEKTGAKYVIGSAFYQLTKKEKLQASKSIIVWDKLSGEYYTGAEARNMLGLAATGEIKIAPGDTPQFEVFVQSGSVNRKLVGGTKVVVYKDAYPVVTWAGVV